jgi:hypothetical protein
VRDPEAREIWAGVYPTLSEGEPGLLGAVLGRAEAHVLRLSVLYAALDRAPAVRPAHLAAALALWDFAEASARRIFGHALGIADADRLVAVLRARGPQTRTAISAIFGRNRSAAAIDALLHLLVSKGRIRRQPGDDEPASGRRPEIWEAV